MTITLLIKKNSVSSPGLKYWVPHSVLKAVCWFRPLCFCILPSLWIGGLPACASLPSLPSCSPSSRYQEILDLFVQLIALRHPHVFSPCPEPRSSVFNKHKNIHRTLWRCRFQFRRFEVGPRFCILINLHDATIATGPWTTLGGARSEPILLPSSVLSSFLTLKTKGVLWLPVSSRSLAQGKILSKLLVNVRCRYLLISSLSQPQVLMPLPASFFF